MHTTLSLLNEFITTTAYVTLNCESHFVVLSQFHKKHMVSILYIMSNDISSQSSLILDFFPKVFAIIGLIEFSNFLIYSLLVGSLYACKAASEVGNVPKSLI